MIKIDYNTYVKKEYLDKIEFYNNKLINIMNDFEIKNIMNGWYYLDSIINEIDLNRINEISKIVRLNSDILIVCATGGSYLATKGVIDSINNYYGNSGIETIFIGNTLSSEFLNDTLEYIKDKNIAINFISKSGDTLEPNIAFDYIYQFMKKKYSYEELKKRVIITTTDDNNNLNNFARENNFNLFYIPKNIGGRFSSLSVVGLLPMAINKVDISKLYEGAKLAKQEKKYENYSIIRDILYNSNKFIESIGTYEPKLASFTDFIKQVFAESYGKDQKGILPISIVNTRELHSLGQYYQEGKQIIFETNIIVNQKENIYIDKYKKDLNEINMIAVNSVAKAHLKNDINTIIIELDSINEFNLGYLIFFFEMTAVIDSYLLCVNYWDQPGVQNYKNIMKNELI